jgi:hypothetical protein
MNKNDEQGRLLREAIDKDKKLAELRERYVRAIRNRVEQISKEVGKQMRTEKLAKFKAELAKAGVPLMPQESTGRFKQNIGIQNETHQRG